MDHPLHYHSSLCHYPFEDQKEMLQDIQQEALRLSRLVEDLLELARSDSGLKMKMRLVNVSEVLLEAWRNAEKLDLSHTFEVGEMPEAFLLADADRLKQLALILLENATKYTPAQGKICMGLSRGDGVATFYIRDTGVGIAAADLKHVFERFYRADKARTRAHDPGGTGLGLAIAEWIVKEHHGKIWLESELGKGTTAWVQLPFHSA